MMLLICLFLANAMNASKEEGKALGNLGKSNIQSQIENFVAQDFLPAEQKGQTFDPQKAKKSVKMGEVSESETVNFLQRVAVVNNKMTISETEHFLNRSEQVQDQSIEIEEATEFTIETCHQNDAPYPVSLIRDLHVEVLFDPGESKEVKVCMKHQSHERFHKKKEAQKYADELKRNFSRDPTIQWFCVEGPLDGGLVHKYTVEAQWLHKDDTQICNDFKAQLKQVHAPRHEEIGDTWVYSDSRYQSILTSPDCTFISSECIDNQQSKTINGKEVHRACWREKLNFICQLPNASDCPYIKSKNCDLISKVCLKEGPYGCNLWELTFKCYSKTIERNIGVTELYGMDEEVSYEPNDSFSEVAAKLAVFDAVKKDLETSQAEDARYVEVFKGRKMQCGKSIADDVMYDCCFAYSGLAKELGLKSCNADEIALAEMRENGFCHYVGSYDGKFCNLWKSRTEHVYCCFSSKLARVLQENARDQLGFGWDDPKHADCRGLKLDEISHLDFSKMDFSELYASYGKNLPSNFQSKLESFESKIKEKVREHQEKERRE